MASLDPFLVAIVPAAIAAAAAWLTAKRQLSGSIDTSTATDLWKAQEDIREWMTKRVAELEAEKNRLSAENFELRQRVTELEEHLRRANGG